MGMLQEFKAFAAKGNAVDLAIGVIVGAAFSKIVDSIVTDLLMPLISTTVGKVDFSNHFIILSDVPPGVPLTLDALKKAGVQVLAWGNFLSILVNFLMLAFITFFMARQMHRLRIAHEELQAATQPPEEVVVLREIRDLLKNKDTP